MSNLELPEKHVEKEIEEDLKNGLELKRPCFYTRKSGSGWLVLLPLGITLLGLTLLLIGS